MLMLMLFLGQKVRVEILMVMQIVSGHMDLDSIEREMVEKAAVAHLARMVDVNTIRGEARMA